MTKDEMQALTVAGLREGMEIMREALQALVDEQNDAPLERRRPQWEAAMKLAREALALESQAEPGGDALYEVRADEEGIAAVYLQGRRVELPVYTSVAGPSAVCALIGCHSGEIHMHSVGQAIPALNRDGDV